MSSCECDHALCPHPEGYCPNIAHETVRTMYGRLRLCESCAPQYPEYLRIDRNLEVEHHKKTSK